MCSTSQRSKRSTLRQGSCGPGIGGAATVQCSVPAMKHSPSSTLTRATFHPLAESCRSVWSQNEPNFSVKAIMILIVDFDADLAETCSMMLEACGDDVRLALSGKDAIAQISTTQPEFLFSARYMHGIPGLQLSERLAPRRSVTGCQILPKSGALKCDGAPGKSSDAFIRKPFLSECLLAHVRASLLQDGSGRTAPAN